ncbi:hypothetical protein GQ42DRAFT_156371 [Ramicandelaber brevisporus]|nr:hypothetical protein GQ42DRAFT_156371 [Ramicandelaber brevisporus]
MAAIILLLLYIIGVVHASIRVLATNKTYPLYDIYGETDPRPYNFSGPLVATSFVPDKFCSLQLPSTSPSLAHGDRGVAFLINAADVTAAKCSTFSWVLRSLPADFPGAVVPRNITALMIFVAEDDSSVDFGNKETEQTDNYWLHTPSRLQLALVGADTGRTLASALDHSPANSTRIHIERDPGPWNRYMDSSAFYAATYIIRASNVAVIAAALILLFVEFRSHLRIGWFRLAIYLNTIIYAFGNIFTMMRYAVAKYRTTIMFVIWMIGNTVFTAVIVRWSRFLLRLPGHHIAYYSLFALCTANIVLYCIALSLSIYAGYCTNPFTIHVATILYSTVSTTFFAFGAVAAFYCNQSWFGHDGF